MKLKKLLCFALLLTFNIVNSYGQAAESQKIYAFKEEIEKRTPSSLKGFKKKFDTPSYSYYEGKVETDLIEQDIHIKYYQTWCCDESTPRPLIFILPGIIGVNPLDHFVANYYATLGYNVAISHFLDLENSKNPEKMAWAIRTNILASIGALDAIIDYKGIDKDKVGLFAYSFGGIRSTFLLSVDHRISAAVLVVSGRDFSKILSTSKFPAISYLRSIHMKHLTIETPEEYETYLRKALPYLPFAIDDQQDYSNYLMVTSDIDDVVPTNLQVELANRLKNSEHIIFKDLGHVTSIVYFAMFYLPYSNQFFSKVWNNGTHHGSYNTWHEDDLEEALLSWD